MERFSKNPQKTIFTFWEPKDRIPGYLQLCMRTWERQLSDYSIVHLDYSNLESVLGTSNGDLALLKTLPLASQKDAIMVSALNRHGGIFMDADTLIRGDIAWTLDGLEHSEIVLFGLHLGFMAARPGAKILSIWERGLRGRLEEVRAGSSRKDEWDFAGNSLLTDAMIEITLDLPFCGLFDRLWRSRPSYHSTSKSFWQKVSNQRRWLMGLPPYRKYLRRLSPGKHGFLAENSYFGKLRYSSVERYRRFWFDPRLEVSEVFRKNQSIVALHNSRTPEWYRELSEEEALRHDSLLSRTLRHLLLRSSKVTAHS